MPMGPGPADRARIIAAIAVTGYDVAMAVYLDDHPLDLEGRALREVLASAGRHMEDSGRIVVEVELDGLRLGGPELEARAEDDVSACDLHLRSAEPGALARDALEAVLVRLGEVDELQSETAAHLQRDDLDEAMRSLVVVLDTWQQAQQAVAQSVALLSIDLVEACGADGAAAVQDLIGQLKTVRRAVESGDHVTLADALAYEWPHTAGRWQQAVGQLIEAIDRQG